MKSGARPGITIWPVRSNGSAILPYLAVENRLTSPSRVYPFGTGASSDRLRLVLVMGRCPLYASKENARGQ